MKIIITSVENGYILTSWYENEPETKTRQVFSEDDARGMLSSVIEQLGLIGSRHDEERLYVIKAPGDKHEKFTEEHAKVIWGD